MLGVESQVPPSDRSEAKVRIGPNAKRCGPVASNASRARARGGAPNQVSSPMGGRFTPASFVTALGVASFDGQELLYDLD